MSIHEKESTQNNHLSQFTRTIININDLNNILNPDCNHGVCGSRNLGNTCYMNSSIACLSNCLELTTYFLSGEYKQNINKKNKYGLGGKLATAWNDLLINYWNSHLPEVSPSKLKSYISKRVKKYSGTNKQDSHEFIIEFLSLLNEDLIKNTKRDYQELKEKQDDETELKCAIRFWDNHRKRNISIITDLFYGLLKSIVICSKCQKNNITFDPFNTLTLPIPPEKYINDKKITHRDIELFYIPKYSIKTSCKIKLHILKDTQFKNMAEEINKIESFKYNLNKLVFIRVSHSKLEGFIDQNQFPINIKEYIFAFDDLSKEGEKTKILPLYLYYKKKVSAFPRLVFLKENMNFGDLKKLIYYYARNYFKSPLNEEIYNVDKELEKYKEKDEENKQETGKEKEQKYDENKLWDLFDKEYNEIFNNNENEEKLIDFFNSFPYKIMIKKEIGDNEELCIFSGKNNFNNLDSFQITKDEDPITTLLENDIYSLNLVLNHSSKYLVEDINLNSCESHTGKDVGKKVSIKYTLYDLLEFFCTVECLGKGNEWNCNSCKEKVIVKKKFSIYYLPRILIICLNRFIRKDSSYSKNDKFIDFPLENLDLEKYLCENAPDKKYSKYDLFAVNQHYGRFEEGHYTAICKNFDGNWYKYDDDKVSKASPEDVVSSEAYVLFYRRRNW